MKTIFYRYLLKNAKELTPNEKILYSFLVSKSLSQDGWAFEKKSGKLDKEAISFFFRNFGNWIPICHINHSMMARELHVSRINVLNGLKSLEKHGYIKQLDGHQRVYLNWELLNGGHIELHRLGEVNGMLAIFYAYVADKGSRHDYSIDTWKVQMARDLDTTFVAITNLLNRLYRLKLAKRLPNGRLQVTPPEKQKSESRQEPTPAANILRPNKTQNFTSGKTSRHLYGRLIQPLPNHNW